MASEKQEVIINKRQQQLVDYLETAQENVNVAKKTKKISEATDATIRILEEEEVRILNEMKATFAQK